MNVQKLLLMGCYQTCHSDGPQIKSNIPPTMQTHAESLTRQLHLFCRLKIDNDTFSILVLVSMSHLRCGAIQPREICITITQGLVVHCAEDKDQALFMGALWFFKAIKPLQNKTLPPSDSIFENSNTHIGLAGGKKSLVQALVASNKNMHIAIFQIAKIAKEQNQVLSRPLLKMTDFCSSSLMFFKAP